VSDSGSVTITVGPVDINLSPVGFRIWAGHYLKCKRDFQSPDPFSPVPYFLLCRAIELELKARHLEALRQKEVKDRFGHNLFRAYAALPPAGQTLDQNEVAVLKAANKIYMGKGFEYFSVIDAVTAFKRFPDLAALEVIAEKLVGNVQPGR